MNYLHFDAFVRSLAGDPRTRRRFILGLIGATLAAGTTVGGPLDSAARKRRKRKKRKRTQRAEAPQTGPCVPEPRSVTCAGVCGTRVNNCGQSVSCSCPEDLSCLSNGTCARVCASDADCGAGCQCSSQSVEGPAHCIGTNLTCFDVSEPCAGTTGCPTGQHCQITTCNSIGRPAVVCVPVCSG